jgi:hypothetical protein
MFFKFVDLGLDLLGCLPVLNLPSLRLVLIKDDNLSKTSDLLLQLLTVFDDRLR